MIWETAALNDFATRWAAGMWAAVWQSTALTLVLLLLSTRLRKTTPNFRLWLWMLVPLRLLVMPILTIPVPVLPAPGAPETAAPPALQTASFVSQHAFGGSDEFAAYSVASEAATPIASAPATPSKVDDFAPPRGVNAAAILMLAWFAGMAFWALRLTRAWRRARRIIARGTPVTDGPLLALARQAADMVGLRRLPRLVITNERVSPFALGTRRPAVVMPAHLVATATQGSLLAVLAHEFTHVRRGDSSLGMLLAICETTYFFHPVVHFVRRRVLLEREQACDSLVLAASNERPSVYARALVAAAELCGTKNDTTAFAAIASESFSDLKVRVASIASALEPRPKLSTGALALLLGLGLLCVPGFSFTPHGAAIAQAQDTAPQNQPPAREAKVTSTETPVPAPVARSKARTIMFPSDRSLGTLFVRLPESLPDGAGDNTFHNSPTPPWTLAWHFLADARGAVSVPEGLPVKLEVGHSALQDLSPLDRLRPDDLYALVLEIPENAKLDVDEAVLPHLSGLTGLKELVVYALFHRGPGLSDKGIRHLSRLENLEVLFLKTDALGDASLSHIARLHSLQSLVFDGLPTGQGLSQLASLSNLRELSVMCNRLGDSGLAKLADLPKLEFLVLEGVGLGDSGLAQLKKIKSLKILTLFGAKLGVTDAGMQYIGQLPNIEELNFVWVDSITDAGVAYLKPLSKLKTLSVHHFKNVTDNGIAQLAALTSLENLRLPMQNSDRGLAAIAQLKNLKTLWCGGGAITGSRTEPGPFTDAGLESVSTLPNLETLVIGSDAGFTDAGIEKLTKLRNLKTLNLCACNMTNQGMRSLASITSLEWLEIGGYNTGGLTVTGANYLNRLTNLRRLSMDTLIRDDAALDLSGLTKLDNVVFIVQSGPQGKRVPALRDEDLAWVASAPNLRGLQSTGGSSFGDPGMAHLASLKHLDLLTIGGDLVTDRGLAYLAASPSLDRLRVEGNFTDAGLRQLENLKSLRHVWVKSKTPLTAGAASRLRTALPNLVLLDTRGAPGAAAGAG
ncbi:MAG: M48 family metalloprotease [Candidatus Hydrogenedentes bacterium]|nr:M48 family metalloprotease [Candidatus Hydrogenedentota bacterium]